MVDKCCMSFFLHVCGSQTPPFEYNNDSRRHCACCITVYGDAKWPQHPLEREEGFERRRRGFRQLIAERASLTDFIIF